MQILEIATSIRMVAMASYLTKRAGFNAFFGRETPGLYQDALVASLHRARTTDSSFTSFRYSIKALDNMLSYVKSKHPDKTDLRSELLKCKTHLQSAFYAFKEYFDTPSSYYLIRSEEKCKMALDGIAGLKDCTMDATLASFLEQIKQPIIRLHNFLEGITTSQAEQRGPC